MKTETPGVTVLTAVRNGMPYLPETVASIQAQTFTDWEYIIVDDASEDDTTSWVEAVARQDSRIRLLRQPERGGPFVAANAGLQVSRGIFVARIDADDLSPPIRLEKQVQVLSGSDRWTACIANKLSFNERGFISGSSSCLPKSPQALKWIFAMGTLATHSSFCFRRDAILQNGGYKPLPTSGDYDLIASLARNDRLLALPEVLSHVRRHPRRLSRLNGKVQSTIGYQLAREHLTAVTGEAWSPEDTEALWAVGEPKAYGLARGLKALMRWKAAWSRGLIEPATASELETISKHLRRRFLWANFRNKPLEVLREFLTSATAPVIHSQ